MNRCWAISEEKVRLASRFYGEFKWNPKYLVQKSSITLMYPEIKLAVF